MKTFFQLLPFVMHALQLKPVRSLLVHCEIGMLSHCYSAMSPNLFQELPSSTNAVESYDRFGRPTHRQPLKLAMLTKRHGQSISKHLKKN